MCIAFFLMFLIIGCQEKRAELTLDEDQLISILSDLEYAQAATYGKERSLKDSMMMHYKDQICVIHRISKEVLEENLKALEDDQEYLKRLLKSVKDSISVEE